MIHVAVHTSAGSCVAQRVAVADTFVRRLIGLLGRAGLSNDEGLLLSPGATIHTLAMRFPIDVVFLDRGLRVLHIVSHLSPWRIAPAPSRTRFALELAAGRARTCELAVNHRLELTRWLGV